MFSCLEGDGLYECPEMAINYYMCTLVAGLTPGSAHTATHCTGKPRGSGWDSGRTKLPSPRAPPMPSDAD